LPLRPVVGHFKFWSDVSWGWVSRADPRAESVGLRVFPRAAGPDELVWAGRSPLAKARSGRAAAGMWDEPGLALVSQTPVAAALWDCLLPPGLGL